MHDFFSTVRAPFRFLTRTILSAWRWLRRKPRPTERPPIRSGGGNIVEQAQPGVFHHKSVTDLSKWLHSNPRF